MIGAVLDRNGLRPGRYWVTDDGLVVLASEAGVLDLDPATVVRKGRLRAGPDVPGRHRAGPRSRRRRDQGRARRASTRTRSGSSSTRCSCRSCPSASTSATRRLGPPPPARLRLHRGGAAGSCSPRWPPRRIEPIGSMGTDTPIAVLSARPRLLFDYFTQLFAQVTNPPLDAIREELVTSIGGAHRARAEPARGPARARPQARAAVPGARQRRARQDHPHRRRRRAAAALPSAHGARPLPGRRRRRRPWPTGSTRSSPRSTRRSRTARASSCSPTGTPTPTRPRSRRCC